MEQERKTVFGQLIIGAPGSGKTTYSKVLALYLREKGRDVHLINLDPGNENSCEKDAKNIPESILPDIDIFELITLDDAMASNHLGPNGGLMFCIEFLEKNIEWLMNAIEAKVVANKDPYLIIDCPGQIELYTHHNSIKNIFQHLTSKRCAKVDLRLACVNLIDSHYCNEPGKYIAALLNCLSSMVHIELPFVNVLSKIDLSEKFGKIAFSLNYYTEVLDLNYLLDTIDDERQPFYRKYKQLTSAIASIIENYSLVTFVPLDINKQASLTQLIYAIDRANGYYLKADDQTS